MGLLLFPPTEIHKEGERLRVPQVRGEVRPALGGPADNFPANFFDFFSRAKFRLREKTSEKATDCGRTEAPFPPLPIFTPRAPPPAYRSIRDRSTMESAILATSRHNTRRARCRDVARIGN